jgi:hypothetical protein
MRRHRPRGSQQVFSDSVRIGMQNKSRKNIAEDHSTEDKNDSADDKNPPGGERRKLLCGLRHETIGTDCSLTRAHGSLGLAIVAAGIARFYADA